MRFVLVVPVVVRGIKIYFAVLLSAMGQYVIPFRPGFLSHHFLQRILHPLTLAGHFSRVTFFSFVLDDPSLSFRQKISHFLPKS